MINNLKRIIYWFLVILAISIRAIIFFKTFLLELAYFFIDNLIESKWFKHNLIDKSIDKELEIV